MQQIFQFFISILRNLPKNHLLILEILIITTIFVASFRANFFSKNHSQDIIDNNLSFPDSNLFNSSPLNSEPLDQENIPIKDNSLIEEDIIKKNNQINDYIISNGDTLISILIQYGVNITDISNLAKQYKNLKNLKIGQSLSWITSESGNLEKLIWHVSLKEERTYEKIEKGLFNEKIYNISGTWHNVKLQGYLKGSFLKSAYSAGFTSNEIASVMQALQWQINFKKLHKGDKFIGFFSREIIKEKQEQSKLIAIRFQTNGKDYFAFRAHDNKFYDLNGFSLSHNFIRYPVYSNFHISSYFNMYRLNPITGKISPHRGVDFAVPLGTSIFSVGDGTVILTKYDKFAGNYIVIKHGHQYITRYMHLKKSLVKAGQKVYRGNKIGISGNTGRSTGPHLHFEIWINRQAVNPLTIKIPNESKLSGSDRTDFLYKVEYIMPKLQFN
ncbi:yebA [Wigglesworthia glossinidia endosymbiont of Glossina brevipalpis]|uniref:YebA protein n=1 Tax=Wigglesworthia glossinidia brevipalpis TaxID=36870 RepID=Q8D384_WIGBR|nr:yebA [Wigglesworthia glossinidia endosymbiont of Glossina brevipalpis]